MTTLSRTPRADEVPELCAGDRLTRDEFERRYAATPRVRKAELIEGVVYVLSPVNHRRHGAPHARLAWFFGSYVAETPGVDVGGESTVRLDLDNEPQPDVLLLVLPECDGRTRPTTEGYIEGAPELVAEVAASSASYDLHDKLNAYRRNGVLEYVVWRTGDRAIDWFVLRGGRYEKAAPGADGLVRSEAFPGLWLDVGALLQDDLKRVLEVVRRGARSPEHASFVARLQSARDTP